MVDKVFGSSKSIPIIFYIFSLNPYDNETKTEATKLKEYVTND
jgi:hypothetical protein